MSLTLVDGGAVEAHNHRLFESIRQKCDVGERAFHEYFSSKTGYWAVYAKYCWVDHLFGVKEHPEFQRPDYFRHMVAIAEQHDPEVVTYVVKRFLGKDYDRHWDYLEFARNQHKIAEDGYDFETQVRPIIIEFGHNLWHLYWKDYYWIKDNQLIVVKRYVE